MRTRRSPCSSISDSRRRKPSSSGRSRAAWARKSCVDAEDDVHVARQHVLHQASGQVSSASGISVWLV
jgi:hypothetical protein